MDAALGVGPGRDLLPLPIFHQGLHFRAPAQAKELTLDGVIIPEPVIAPDGVEHPVSDVDQIQKIAEFLARKIDLHGDSLLKIKIVPIIARGQEISSPNL